MDKVVDIRPNLKAERILDDQVLERKIESLIRACDKLGTPVVISILDDSAAKIFISQCAAEDDLRMRGVLDEAKDALKNEPIFEIDLE